MENIWRFFDQKNCISGIVVADSENLAITRANEYLINHFTDIKSVDLCVWKVKYDDDYNKKYPYAVAISY